MVLWLDAYCSEEDPVQFPATASVASPPGYLIASLVSMVTVLMYNHRSFYKTFKPYILCMKSHDFQRDL